MYGNGGSQLQSSHATVSIESPIEQLSSINESTVKQLTEAKLGLSALLDKIRGAQPESEVPPKLQGGHLMATAYELRSLAQEIARKVGELHNIIGLNK